METIICLMHYNALHHWSKFETKLTFQCVKTKKPPRSSLKLYFLLVRKHLKFQNLKTTNLTWMNLGPDMYHLNTFNNAKEKGIFYCHPPLPPPLIGGCFLLESNFTFKSAPLLSKLYLVAESIIFLHITSFLCSIFL